MQILPLKTIFFGLMLSVQSFTLQAMRSEETKEESVVITTEKKDAQEPYKCDIKFIKEIRSNINIKNTCFYGLSQYKTPQSFLELVEDYSRASTNGKHEYIALFVAYCIALGADNVYWYNDLVAIPYGETLFKIVQAIEFFEGSYNVNCRLCLNAIPGIKDVLKDLLKILQLLTKKTITDLDLSNNNLEEIPDTISNLPDLEALNVSNNCLTQLPLSMQNLTKLKELYLSVNSLERIDTLINLVMLQILHLDENKLIKIDERINNLKALKTLYLFDNDLTDLPENIAELINLIVVKIGKNKLTKLPSSFGKLTKLIVLSLYNNELTDLPVTIVKLENLIDLDLSNNKLQTVPKLLCDRVRQLYTDSWVTIK